MPWGAGAAFFILIIAVILWIFARPIYIRLGEFILNVFSVPEEPKKEEEESIDQ